MSETTKVQHTPGPWKWVGDDLESQHVGAPNYGAVLEREVDCGMWCQGGVARLVISDADRALIAAAPKLLALLIESQEHIGGDWRERRDAAIREATEGGEG